MNIKSLLFLALIFINSVIEAASYSECYSKKDGSDVCIKHNFEVTEYPEKFSSGFFDELIDSSGRTFYDAVISGAASYGKGLGQDLAMQGGILVAKELGLDAIVDVLGGGDGPSQIELIDELLSMYSTKIINEIKVSEDRIVNVIQLHCSGAADVDYKNINTQLSMFYADTYEVKKESHNLSNLSNIIYDLGRLREEFGTVANDYCFFSEHTKYMYWFSRLVSTEIEAIIARENIEYEGTGEFSAALNRTLEAVIANDSFTGGVERVISELESSDPNDSENEWWYEVNRNFSDLSINEYSSPSEAETNPNKFSCKGEQALSESRFPNSLNTVIDNLLDNEFPDRPSYYEYLTELCPNAYSYSYDQIVYTVDIVILKVCTRWDEDGRTCNGTWTIPVPTFVDVDASHVETRRGVHFLDFASQTLSAHKEYAYAQLLQQTYAPYQGVFDYWWDLVGRERPSNKMDRELDRTTALDILDYDGLSVSEEVNLGTDPRVDDTDGDGFDDGFEFYHSSVGFDPLIVHDTYSDADGDGSGDLEEYAAGTDMFDFEDNPEVRAERQKLAAIMVPVIALILN